MSLSSMGPGPTSVLVPLGISGPLSSGSSVSSGGGSGHQNSGASGKSSGSNPKKPRLVFTDLQRRTLQAIFKETKRPSKEMQITISQQLGLELSTVGNFFMNARRRSQDKWMEDTPGSGHHRNGGGDGLGGDSSSAASSATGTPKSSKGHKQSGGASGMPTSMLAMGSNVIVSCT